MLSFGEMVAPTFEATLWCGRLAYVGIAWVPVAWLAFALSFTGQHAWLRSAPFRLAVGFAAATAVVAVTMPWHDWMWTEIAPAPYGPFRGYEVLSRGWWFWVMAAVGWTLSTVGTVLVFATYARSQRSYRQLSVWLAVGAVLPVAVTVAFVAGLLPGKDPSSLGSGLGAVAVAHGIFRHRFLDLHPVARTSLVESLSEGLVAIDAHGRVTDFNPALAALAGPELQIGAPLAQAVPALAAARDQPEGEAVFGGAGGGRHVEWRAADLGQADGDGRLVVLRDVTERQLAQDALGDALAELRVQNQDLDAFAHTVAHDLKNPIHTIRGYAEVLHDDGHSMTPEMRDESARVIMRTADTMNAIIQEMLLLASIRHRDVPHESVDLAAVAGQVRARLAPVLDRYDATLETPASWPTVVTYGPWIEEVWANFVTNAAKYGGPCPRVQIGADDQGETVRLWVRDHGPGLSLEDCERVFLPFTRVSESQVEGHGLGLAIVSRIAEKLGGAAGVESEPGDGCRFYVTLPAPLAAPVETAVG